MTDPTFDVQDMRAVGTFRWPYRTAREHRVHEFTDAPTGRVLRVMGMGRVTPEDAARAKASSGESNHRHRHNFDQLYLRVRLPLPGGGGDPVDPVAGTIEYRPEGVFYGPFEKKRTRAETGSVGVFCGIQTSGASGQPFLSKEQVVAAVERLVREGPGRFDQETGDYTAPDGTEQDFYEITWETAMGRKARYPDPPRAEEIMSFPVGAYAWSRSAPGVATKRIASFDGGDPAIELIKLDAGARLVADDSGSVELTAVLAGGLRIGERGVGDLHVLHVSPHAARPPIVATEPTLLWTVRWRA
ncbi:MAG TPA: hypothetical protein VFC31_01900 [Candidatus Limnocylindria bacterium]|nr:hypothetical protein [Candidatus Limnocylindria bacterium]